MVAVETMVDERNAKHLLKKIQNTTALEANKQIVINYYNEKLAGGMKQGSLVNSLKILSRVIACINKPLVEIQKEELIAFFNNLKPDFAPLVTAAGTLYKNSKNEYSLTTSLRMKTQVKTFWKWLGQNYKLRKNEQGIPLAVAWINGTENKNKFYFKKDILTREEIQLMIKSTPKPRNKAIIAILFESGMRVGELLSMRKSELQLNEEYCEFVCDGKTGKRPVVLVQSYPYLQQWLDWLDKNRQAINKKDQDFVWFNHTEFGRSECKPMFQRGTILNMIKYVAARAGIQKRVWTHGLRHASATDFARQGYNETEMRLKFGWTSTSTIPSNYTHYRHDELKNKMLVRSGKKTEIKEFDAKIIPLKTCPFCSYENPVENQYCGKCAKPLEAKVIKEMEKTMKAYAFTNEVINNLSTLEKKGFDIRRFNEFMEEWVNGKH